MSFWSERNVPFFALFKKTFGFVLSKRRLEVLLKVPFVLLLAASFFAVGSVRKIVLPQGKVTSINVLFILLFLLFSFAACLIAMVRAHLLYAHGDAMPSFKDKAFYKRIAAYLWALVQTLFAGEVVTAFWAAVFYLIVFKWLGAGEFSMRFFVLTAIAVSPYFIIRFCCKLAAAAKGEKLSLFGAWKMTRKTASSLSLCYLSVGTLPFVVLAIGSGLTPALMYLHLPAAAVNYLSVLFLLTGLLLSGASQAAFMSALYECLKERDLSDEMTEKTFFSVAKDKKSD